MPAPRIAFHDYLPEVFRDVAGSADVTRRFLNPLETLFEELQAEIEGTRVAATGVLTGGIPDLFDPDLSPPVEFGHGPSTALPWLEYLASWIGVPLRPERDAQWNRQFIKAAIQLSPRRGTLPGISGLLRAWLKGDILELEPMVTDLTRPRNDVTTVLQLGTSDMPGVFANLTLGVNTVLGEGPPFLFIVDLVQDIRQPASATGAILDAARALLDLEKPAYSHYQLRLRLAPLVWIFDSATGRLRQQPWLESTAPAPTQ